MNIIKKIYYKLKLHKETKGLSKIGASIKKQCELNKDLNTQEVSEENKIKTLHHLANMMKYKILLGYKTNVEQEFINKLKK
jgi:hypothetical protein